MTEKKITPGRTFYENEAFFTWEQIKGNLPEPRHIDLASNNSELRVFLFVRAGEDQTVEFINFGLDEDQGMLDASYIMKNYYHIDYCALEGKDAAFAWERYKCQGFIESGAQFDSAVSNLYDIILGNKKNAD